MLSKTRKIFIVFAFVVLLVVGCEKQEIVESRSQTALVLRNATMQDDVSLCDLLKVGSNRELCILNYYVNLAVKNQDITICQKIQDQKGIKNCEIQLERFKK